jgi:ArsR family transcriptional regulator
MAPKAVIEHLSKLERAGLIESITDESRRKYYYISRKLRLEIDLAPHMFGVGVAVSSLRVENIPDKIFEIHSIITELMKSTTLDMRDVISQLEKLRKVQKTLSDIQFTLTETINESFNRLVEFAERSYEDALYRVILVAIGKGTRYPEEMAEELGVSVRDVQRVLSDLEKAGVVKKEVEKNRIMYTIHK